MSESLPGFMIFSSMSVMLLVGVFLRAKVKFFQTAMIPSSITAGVLGFILVNLGWLKFPMLDGSFFTVKADDFTPIIFHAFNISFISLCLTRPDRKQGPKHSTLKGALWLSYVWSASLTVQALVAAGTVVVYNLVSGETINVFLGFLATHGFTQGPGQGLALGGAWASGFQISDGLQMGLIWAAMGFVAAYVVGIPYARYFVKKGMNVNNQSRMNKEFLSGILNPETHKEAGRETTHSSATETLAYHLSIIGVVYLITYVEITLASKFIDHLLFSYPMFFLHGVIWASLLRLILDKTNAGRLSDPGVQKRITGMSIDFLLVSSIMGISFVVLAKYIGIIIAVTISITIVTFLMVEFFRKRVSELGPERAVAIFGSCCGSSASGLLLLRILDSDYSSGVGTELAFFNALLLFTAAPIMAFMAPNLPGFSIQTIVCVYALFSLICFGILMFLNKWKKSEVL